MTSTELPLRKKAWERAKERGLIARIALRLGRQHSTVRRWFLEPDHADRNPIVDPKVSALLNKEFDLQPNDFIWLHGEKSARRRLQQKAAV